MSQPTFVPISPAGAVRAVRPTTPVRSVVVKPGLQRHATVGVGTGTPAPNEGFAFTLAERALAAVTFVHHHDRADVVCGVALLAAKRANVLGRAPTSTDVAVVLELFRLKGRVRLEPSYTKPFAGLSHSYVAQRAFVDEVSAADLGVR